MKQFVLLLFIQSSISVYSQVQALAVESNHSRVTFTIDIAGFSKLAGMFTEYSIDLDWDKSDFTKTKIRSEINIASINTGIPERDSHLQSDDFFNAEANPKAIFISDSIQLLKRNYYQTFGTLTLNGISKTICIPFELRKIDGNTLGISANTTINRKDFSVGEDFKHTNTPNFLNDSVNVQIDFWTKRRK